MLDHSAISRYLLSEGLVEPRAVVEEDLSIVDVSRRNSVFIAATRSGPTFVIKQAGGRGARTLAHEAAVLGALGRTAELADLVPAVVGYDAGAARLVLSTPAGARDWSAYHGKGRFPRTQARLLARALAALHRLPPDEVEELPSSVDPMWALSLPEPPHELVLDLSGGAEEVVARVQASRALCDRLERVRDTCASDGVTHGDLRWDNCLAVPAPRSRRMTRLLLVDWELAGRGAVGFDTGTVLAEYLRVWVGSIPIVDPSDPGRFAGQAAHPLRGMQPAIQAFWAAYRNARAGSPGLRRVVELAAVRLLQTAVERAQGLTGPSAHVMTLVQLADNLLRDPEDAARSLLALAE